MVQSINRKPALTEPDDEKTFPTPYGAFTLRRPTIRMQREIHLTAARGLQGLQNVDAIGESINFMMATVDVCARTDRQLATGDRPTGWPLGFNWDHAYDFDWLSKLFGDHAEWVSSFRSTNTDDGNQETGNGGQPVDELRTEAADALGAA